MGVVLVEEGLLDAALVVARANKNRAEARTVANSVLLRIPGQADPSAEWQFVRDIWSHLTPRQHRDLEDRVAELGLKPPRDIAERMSESRQQL